MPSAVITVVIGGDFYIVVDDVLAGDFFLRVTWVHPSSLLGWSPVFVSLIVSAMCSVVAVAILVVLVVVVVVAVDVVF